MIHLTCLSISTTLSLERTGLFLTISFGEVNLSLGDIILYLGELGPFPGKTCMTGETCSSLAFSLGEVKLFAIFSIGEKNLLFGVILSFSRNFLLLRGTTLSPYPHLENMLYALSLKNQVSFPSSLEQ